MNSLNYQMFDLVEELVDFVTVGQSDVRFAEEAANLLLEFGFVDVDHDHEGDQVVEQRRQEPILFVLQTLAFRLAQRLVPERDNIER